MHTPQIKFQAILALLFLVTASSAQADVSLPRLFGNNMVLQRNQPIHVWGWAKPEESITVTFKQKTHTVTANNDGNWSTTLAASSHGGPYQLSVSTNSNTIEIENILIGDVWVCSGQSNMELGIRDINNADEEIANGDHPMIRMFTAPQRVSFKPEKDLPRGQWKIASPDTLADFSAVGYLFGRELQQELDVPIGFIHTSWGGTAIHAWTSWDTVSRSNEYPDFDPTTMETNSGTGEAGLRRYEDALESDKGIAEKWYSPTTDFSNWKPIEVPGLWTQWELSESDGIVWFHTEFEVPPELAGKPATLSFGTVDDWDFTYINGTLVGSTTEWDEFRLYSIDKDILQPNTNTLVVKIQDTIGEGGFYGNADYIFIEIEGVKIPLTQGWTYKPSVLSAEFGVVNMAPNTYPSRLYNAMIHPIIEYGIKGVIWYQGENDADHAYLYRTKFSNMITDWRSKWGEDFPFYWVQLPNFMQPADQPKESSWAELREAQDIALALPNTGQAITIDIGETADIHPKNKQDVGHRLALAALHTTYGKDIVYSGPRYKSMKTRGAKITLSLDHGGSGLIAKGDKYGYLKGFTIAGKDQKFVWAQARIENGKIIVWSDKVKKPVAVRYAWADNPDDANLYNTEMLPAAPFRTDDWLGLTFE